MTGQKKALIHNWKTGGYNIYAVAYGKDPYGPHGGTCGVINDGEFVTYGFAGTGSFGIGAPEWMQRAAAELDTLPDGEYEITHTPGSRQYEIVCLEIEEKEETK